MKPHSSLRKLQAIAVAFAAVALICPISTFGQATDGIIVGVVTDSTGSAIAGANVVATCIETRVKYTTVTVATGEYRINNVPIGYYDVTATATGFATAFLDSASAIRRGIMPSPDKAWVQLPVAAKEQFMQIHIFL